VLLIRCLTERPHPRELQPYLSPDVLVHIARHAPSSVNYAEQVGSLGYIFSQVPDKAQACNDLIQLAHKKADLMSVS